MIYNKGNRNVNVFVIEFRLSSIGGVLVLFFFFEINLLVSFISYYGEYC